MMMDDNKFFKLVWRINGLAILAVAGLSFIILLYGAYYVFDKATRQRNVRNVVNIESAEVKDEVLRLGHMSEIGESPYVIIPLMSDQNYSQDFLSKSASSARNYLFLNSNTNEKTWLLPHNNFLFEGSGNYKSGNNVLYNQGKEADQVKKPLAHLFKVIKADTNADNRLNSQDLLTIALSKIDGTQYTEIIGNIDDFLGDKVNEQGLLLVLYKKGNTAYSATIDLSDFKIVHETTLSQ